MEYLWFKKHAMSGNHDEMPLFFTLYKYFYDLVTIVDWQVWLVNSN